MPSVPTVEIARQLTMLEQETFSSLKGSEFLSRGWLRADKDTHAPNIGIAIRRFNKISNYWATEILRQESSAKRVAYIEWLIRLASEFHMMQNYSSLLQITAALTATPVWRLTETWDAVSLSLRKTFDFLKGLVSSGQNWEQQRQALLQKSPPSIPFVGMYLTELVFLEESGPTVEDNTINFEKPRKVASIIQEIQLLQQTKFNFEVLDYVRQYFSSAEPLDEAKRFEASYVIMPRSAIAQRPASTRELKLPLASTQATPPGSARGSSKTDRDFIRTALAETAGDTDARTAKASASFQKSVAQFLKARGATSVTVTDQSRAVYDCVSKVTLDCFELNGSTYVVSWRLTANKSDVSHVKRLSVLQSHGGVAGRPLLICAQIDHDEVFEFAREMDVSLVPLTSRPKSASVSPRSSARP